MNIVALVPAVFLAGVLMFLAPCTLPLVPAYLAFIGGRRGTIVRNACAFVVGFSLVFIVLGLGAGFLGSHVGAAREYLSRAAGLLIILFGLTMLGVIKLPALSHEWKIKIPHFITIGRWESSLLIGALFALGWSPCIGPILGTVLLLASGSTTALQGALLLGVFSLGLGVPFLLTAVLLKEAQAHFAKWGSTIKTLSYIGGVILIILGVLMVLGEMGLLISWGYGLFNFAGYSRLLQYL